MIEGEILNNIIGQKFFDLTILEKAGVYKNRKKNQKRK